MFIIDTSIFETTGIFLVCASIYLNNTSLFNNIYIILTYRAMGYFIRFIHNRDLAAENIMTAYCRFRLVLDSCPGSIFSVTARLKEAGIKLPQNSMLKLATGDLLDKPGAFNATYKPSRRNSKNPFVSECPVEVICDAGNLLRHLKFPQISTQSPLNTYTMMIAGVYLNGRQYSQGSHCSYYPFVTPRHNQQGIGGLDGSVSSLKIGTIWMFYRFQLIGNSSLTTFVSITDRPIVGNHGNLKMVDTVKSDTLLPNFNHRHDPSVHNLIHIDSISHKVKLVPHFDASNNEHMFAINMWEAR